MRHRPSLAFFACLLIVALTPLLLTPSSGSAQTAEPEVDPVESMGSEPSGSEPAEATEASEAKTPSADEPSADESDSTPEGESAGVEPSGSGKVVVGRIDGDIDLAVSAYVKRLIEAATVAEASALMIELNTFGGRVDAAVLIRDALIDAPMQTAVFINKRAISAGALISFACDSIAISSGATIGAATPVASGPGQEVPEAVAEKYVSYFRAEMRSTAETKGRNGDIAEAMVDADAEIPDLSEKGKLLTLNTQSALEHGIADVEAKDLQDALKQLGLEGQTQTVENSWSEDLVAFLTSPAMVSLLALGMLLLGYLEIQTPGVGIFGAGALLCALLLYFSHYLVNLAGSEEVLLLVLGILLVIVEVLLAPTMGILGIVGALSILTSLIMTLMAGDWSDITFENPFTQQAVLQVLLIATAAVILMGLMFRYMPVIGRRTRFGGHLILARELESDDGYQSHEEASDGLVGEQGPTLTPLRPSGKARIAGQRINVETEGDFIDRGVTVRVLRQEPGRTIVRQV